MIRGSSSVLLENFKELNKKTEKGLIVFAGDSMIEYLNTAFYFPEFRIVNRGVAGATSKFMIDNLDDIFGEINPGEIWLSIGSNDLTLLDSNPKQIAYDVAALLDNIKKKFPNTRIYYLSATPVINEDHKLYRKLYVGGKTIDQQLLINKLMSEVAKEKDVTFVNCFDNLFDSKTGYLNEKYTPDGIHLNREGYRIYTKKIIDILNDTKKLNSK